MKNRAVPGRPEAASHRGLLVRAFQTQLESFRLRAGLSRRAFADRLGVPRSSYFHLMSEAGNPSLETVEMIASRIGVEPWAFFPPEGDDSKRDDWKITD